jgi:hypothetical protein
VSGEPWREAFDRVRIWHSAVDLIDELGLDPWSTWECPWCGQPSPAANPDRERSVHVLCGYCGFDWWEVTPAWMLAPSSVSAAPGPPQPSPAVGADDSLRP